MISSIKTSKSKSFIETHINNTSYNTKIQNMIKYKLIYIYVYFKPLYKLTKAFWATTKKINKSRTVCNFYAWRLIQNENIYISVEVECRSNYLQVQCSSIADGSKNYINILFYRW